MISALVVSVGYGRELEMTLPHNKRLVDQVIVVTTADDQLSQEIVRKHDATLVISDRCYEDEHAFNKGKMLNDGLRNITCGWVINTDADILLHPHVKNIDIHLDPQFLYYTNRFDIRRQSVQDWKDGKFVRYSSPSGKNDEPSGYFQLWHTSTERRHHECFCSAGGVDWTFMRQWRPDQLHHLPEIPVHHIQHAKFYSQNWNGIVAEKTKWRQLGIINHVGPVILPNMELEDFKNCEFYLVHMNTGTQSRVFICDENLLMPNDVIQFGDKSIMFCGREVQKLQGEAFYIAFKHCEKRLNAL